MYFKGVVCLPVDLLIRGGFEFERSEREKSIENVLSRMHDHYNFAKNDVIS